MQPHPIVTNVNNMRGWILRNIADDSTNLWLAEKRIKL